MIAGHVRQPTIDRICCVLGGRNVTKKKKPPIYRVMLHNDSFNRREYVVSVLLKVVDGLAMDEAVNVMQVTIVPARSDLNAAGI